MKCIICKSPDIELKTLEEEIKVGNDIFLYPIEVLVCSNCGERYYDSKTMRKLEEIKTKIEKKDLDVKDVGKIFRARVA